MLILDLISYHHEIYLPKKPFFAFPVGFSACLKLLENGFLVGCCFGVGFGLDLNDGVGGGGGGDLVFGFETGLLLLAVVLVDGNDLIGFLSILAILVLRAGLLGQHLNGSKLFGFVFPLDPIPM